VKDWIARIVRTLAQMIAGGGFTLLFDQFVKDISDPYKIYVALGATLFVTFVQNMLEEANKIPTLMKPASPPAPSTVEPVA
jgi:K+-transporting ATPase A subunit